MKLDKAAGRTPRAHLWISHTPIPQDVVRHNHPAGPHQLQQLLKVLLVRALVRICQQGGQIPSTVMGSHWQINTLHGTNDMKGLTASAVRRPSQGLVPMKAKS